MVYAGRHPDVIERQLNNRNKRLQLAHFPNREDVDFKESNSLEYV